MLAKALNLSPAAVGAIAGEEPRKALMSTSVSGLRTSSFMRSRSVVPPARKAAPDPSAREASIASSALKYVKGRMTSVPLHLRLGLFHGCNDMRIGRASAEIPAHILADVIVVFRMAFVHAGDRRHDLSG